MNNINPKKLLNSKWTAVSPLNKEKHFQVIKVKFDDRGAVIVCIIEAVLTGRAVSIEWQTLKNYQHWRHGWV